MLDASFQVANILVNLITLVTFLIGVIKIIRETRLNRLHTVSRADSLDAKIGHLVENTNGMSERLQQLAGQAGERRGRDQQMMAQNKPSILK